MTKLLIDAIGWVGAGMLLFAYGCVSFRKLRADSLWYQSMNAIGSLFLVANTFYYRAFPSTFVNLVWITIAIVAAIRMKNQEAHVEERASEPTVD
ncbi:MAG: CBU_0592 family membrane protein [Terriglobales bacterium]